MKLPLLLTPGNILSADTQEPLCLEESHLCRHAFIGGNSGGERQ